MTELYIDSRYIYTLPSSDKKEEFRRVEDSRKMSLVHGAGRQIECWFRSANSEYFPMNYTFHKSFITNGE